MNKKGRRWLGVSLAAALPLAFASTAAAVHMDVPLRAADGSEILDSSTPYSPKATCMTGAMGCHTEEEYRSATTKTVTKTQGVLDPSGEVFWQSYNVHSAAHGAVVGRHSQHGRNEDYSIDMKKKFKDAFFTSSPGMYGKY